MAAQHRCPSCRGWTQDDLPCVWCQADPQKDPGPPWVELKTLPPGTPFTDRDGNIGLSGSENEHSEDWLDVVWIDCEGEFSMDGVLPMTTPVRALRIVDPYTPKPQDNSWVELKTLKPGTVFTTPAAFSGEDWAVVVGPDIDQEGVLVADANDDPANNCGSTYRMDPGEPVRALRIVDPLYPEEPSPALLDLLVRIAKETHSEDGYRDLFRMALT